MFFLSPNQTMQNHIHNEFHIGPMWAHMGAARAPPERRNPPEKLHRFFIYISPSTGLVFVKCDGLVCVNVLHVSVKTMPNAIEVRSQ